ncbi:MAG: hypothetical protein ACI9MR_003152 [Myxococcota bacterium]|jgi:hypothetical protein
MTIQLRENDRGRVSVGDDKKKKAAPELGKGAVPEGAAKDPGAALLTIGAESAANLLTLLQAAGGNLAVNAETSSLEEGRMAATTAKSDKDAFDAMSDVEKVEFQFAKKGSIEPSGAAPPAEGAPPPGFSEPGVVVSFHAERAGQVQQVSDAYGALSSSCMLAAGVIGLDEATMMLFQEMGNAYMEAQAKAMELRAAYDLVAGEMASNEFAAAAMPAETLPAIYQERVAIMETKLAAMQSVLESLNIQLAEIDAEIAAAVGAQGAAIEELALMTAQIGEAAAAAEGGGDGEQADPAAQLAPIQAKLEGSRATVSALEQKKTSIGALSNAVSGQVAAMQGVVTAYYLLLGAQPPVADLGAAAAEGG